MPLPFLTTVSNSRQAEILQKLLDEENFSAEECSKVEFKLFDEKLQELWLECFNTSENPTKFVPALLNFSRYYNQKKNLVSNNYTTGEIGLDFTVLRLICDFNKQKHLTQKAYKNMIFVANSFTDFQGYLSRIPREERSELQIQLTATADKEIYFLTSFSFLFHPDFNDLNKKDENIYLTIIPADVDLAKAHYNFPTLEELWDDVFEELMGTGNFNLFMFSRKFNPHQFINKLSTLLKELQLTAPVSKKRSHDRVIVEMSALSKRFYQKHSGRLPHIRNINSAISIAVGFSEFARQLNSQTSLRDSLKKDSIDYMHLVNTANAITWFIPDFPEKIINKVNAAEKDIKVSTKFVRSLYSKTSPSLLDLLLDWLSRLKKKFLSNKKRPIFLLRPIELHPNPNNGSSTKKSFNLLDALTTGRTQDDSHEKKNSHDVKKRLKI